MYNIKLVITYDGTNFFGWQKTHMGRSIEQFLLMAIEQIVQHPIKLQAASRTDAGVHAHTQVVNFFTSKELRDLSLFRIGLNHLLPKEIVVLKAEVMPSSFHPTTDCTGKEYRYHICLGSTQLPHHRFYSWHVPYTLNLDTLKQAFPHLIGTHNFSAFCNVKKNAKYSHYIRQVSSLELMMLENHRVCISISGNHFLYKMVRNIVGTLVDVGRGKIPVETLPDILKSENRKLAGVTAPAHGLFLYKIIYE